MSRFKTFFTLILLLPSLLFAQQDPRNYSKEGVKFDIDSFVTGASKIKTDKAQGNKLRYNEWGGKLSYRGKIFNREDDYFFSAGLDQINLNWNENPHVQTKHFTNANFAGGMEAEANEQWLLKSIAALSFDIRYPKTSRLAFFTYGTYFQSPDWLFHIGFMGYREPRKLGALPILGFSFMNHEMGLRFKAIFPMKLSVSYKLNPQWLAVLRYRYQKLRHRGKGVNSGDRNIFEYRLHGAELAFKYEPNYFSQLSVYAGFHPGAEYRAYDKNGHHRQIYKTKAGMFYGFGGHVIF